MKGEGGKYGVFRYIFIWYFCFCVFYIVDFLVLFFISKKDFLSFC